jgi:hypothetical protein
LRYGIGQGFGLKPTKTNFFLVRKDGKAMMPPSWVCGNQNSAIPKAVAFFILLNVANRNPR